MKKTVFVLVSILLLLTNVFFISDDPKNHPVEYNYVEIDYPQIKDTLYTQKDQYIEVDLIKQIAILHQRNDTSYMFNVSTGNARLEKGVDTKPGLFVIQSMMPKTYSRQFDSTVMLYWMGFNYGIGFHGLLGNSYYKYLGKKPSSHGCIRVARKDAEIVYKKVTLGTPVLVHTNNNLLVIAFSDDTSTYSKPAAKDLLQVIETDLTSIYAGKYFLTPHNKMIIDKDDITHVGLPLGDRQKLPLKQTVLMKTN